MVTPFGRVLLGPCVRPALTDLGSGDWSGGCPHGTNFWSGRFGGDQAAEEEEEEEEEEAEAEAERQ